MLHEEVDDLGVLVREVEVALLDLGRQVERRLAELVGHLDELLAAALPLRDVRQDLLDRVVVATAGGLVERGLAALEGGKTITHIFAGFRWSALT